MLIMRYCLPNVPAATGLRQITSPHVQIWIWPAQLFRGLVLSAVFYPLRATFLRMGRFGELAVPEVLAQTLLFRYLLLWWERAAAHPALETLHVLSDTPA